MGKRGRESQTPDITPLIDVVFLLLIFFMVSTVFKKNEHVLALNLPPAKSGEGRGEKKEKLSIELSSDKIALNGKILELRDLEQTLKAKTDKTVPIELSVDRGVVYERVVSILEKLKKHSFSNLSLITDAK